MRTLTFALALIFTGLTAAIPPAARAQVYVSFVAPPLMPEYVQPELTTPNSIWMPGYWAYGSQGYYWVPGAWVQPPSLGMLWTPGYWGENTGGGYGWNEGYWGPTVGYYGGINYGAGYYGNGYVGGGWYGNQFRYNTAVTRVNPQYVRNVYVNKTVIVRNVTRYGYNGRGGVIMKPDSKQIAYARERHIQMTPVQRAHVTAASRDHTMYASVNHGQPGTVTTVHPVTEKSQLNPAPKQQSAPKQQQPAKQQQPPKQQPAKQQPPPKQQPAKQQPPPKQQPAPNHPPAAASHPAPKPEPKSSGKPPTLR